MVTIQNEKLIIEIEHPCPEEFVKELKGSIIYALQNMEVNEFTDLVEYRNANFILLELLSRVEDYRYQAQL